MIRYKALVTASALAIGLVGVAAPTAVASTASATTVSPQHTASIKCDSPKGAKANFSWEDGIDTVTVYYNNHCSHRVDAQLAFISGDGFATFKCLHVGAGVKGHTRYDTDSNWVLNKINKGC